MRSNAKAVMARISARLKSKVNEMPKILANEGQKHFNENFKSQSFEGQKWPEVERRKPGTFAYKYPKKKYLARRTNPILIGKTRKLKNMVNRSVKSVNLRRIIWGVYGPEGKYGMYNNDGIGQRKRTFMAPSYKLKQRLIKRGLQLFRK